MSLAESTTSPTRIVSAEGSALAATRVMHVPAISWVHPPEGFLRLSLLNGVLRILTLGVYHFWGKTEVRQRIWSAVRIDGEPLDYRGTGGELFRGFLIVFFLILLPMLAFGFAGALLLSPTSPARGLFEVSFYTVPLALTGIGIHRARRYRLSRTRWRGIRGGQSGRSWRFAWLYLWTMVLIPITLGWIVPWRTVQLQKALFDDTRFGDKAFTFSGSAGPLYRRYWLVWLSAIVLLIGTLVAVFAIIGFDTRTGVPRPATLTGKSTAMSAGVVFFALLLFAIIRAWYTTRVLNYFASRTQFQGTAFTLAAKVGSFVWLTASNYLIRVLSLGFLSPIAEARSTRYIVDRLAIDGPVAWSEIGQNPDALLKSGEGLAEAFNVDAF
jgi:uncharacterized membrane protein YjgN (DUF898 family)